MSGYETKDGRLDVTRFGESNGFERNVVIDDLWPFRDYVIKSINDDKPFNQFIREQLAGDELSGWKSGQPATPEIIDRAVNDTVPRVMPMFWSFRIMVGMGLLMLATSWIGWWLYRRSGWRPERDRKSTRLNSSHT